MAQDPSQPKSASGTQTKSKSPMTHRSKLRAFFQFVGQLVEIVLAFVPLIVQGIGRLGRLLLKGLQWLQQRWSITLPKLRTVLPSWNQKLPDWVFTSVAIGLLCLLVSLPITLWSNRSAATAANAIEKSHVTRQYDQPDPKRLMAVQTQLADVTDRYGEDLLQAVQLQFAQRNLTISVSDAWLTLSPEQQEQLANNLLQRSQRLSFRSLEIRNLAGKTLARNPVVGSKMVLFVDTNQA